MNTKILISAALISVAAIAMTGCGDNNETFIKVNNKKVQFTSYGMIDADFSGVATTPETPVDSLCKSFSDKELTKEEKKAFISKVKGAYKEPYYMVQAKVNLNFDKETISMIKTDTYTKYPTVNLDKKFLDTLKTYRPTEEFITWLAAKGTITMDRNNYNELVKTNREMNCFDESIIPELAKAAKDPNCKNNYCSIKWSEDFANAVSYKNQFTKHVVDGLPPEETYSSEYRFKEALLKIAKEDEGNCNFADLVLDLGLTPHAKAFVKAAHGQYKDERIMTKEENNAIIDAINDAYDIFDDIPTL